MESRLSKLATRLRSLWSVFAGTVCDLGLMLLPMCRSSEVKYSPEHLAWMSRPHEPQLIGGRWDGMTERDASKCVHRIVADADTCWLEIVDPITGHGDRYEQYGRDWRWSGRLREAAR